MNRSWVLLLSLLVALSACAAPTDNPVAARYRATPEAVPAWVNALPWDRVVSVADVAGETPAARVAAAQAALVARGGGVLYFPAGDYVFTDDVILEDGVILRGAPPVQADAKDAAYALDTRFEFPRYHYSGEGAGTPNDTAFKGIRLRSARDCRRVGVVHVAINRAHVYFAEDAEHATAAGRLVFGCVLTNTASVAGDVPNPDYRQLPHQRWTARHRAAIHVFGADAFLANNRIPQSGDDNFTVKPYALVQVTNGKSQGFNIKNPAGKPFRFITIEEGVTFDYDNRPGIYLNPFGIGGGAPATPETHPWGFRTGGVVRDNFIYCSGRSAVHFAGDGAYIGYNVIRFPEGLRRPTTTGLVASDGSATNDNRACTARGWRWVIEGNDYIVHSNVGFGGQKINDGEGLMHENWDNSTIRDSAMIGNVGNRYLCLWDVDVDGLLLERNTVTAGGAAIHVLGGGRNVKRLTIRENTLPVGSISVTAATLQHVSVTGNKVEGGVSVTRTPLESTALAEDVVVSGNICTAGEAGVVTVTDLAWARGNLHYRAELPKPKPRP